MAGNYKRDGTLVGRSQASVELGARFGAWTYVGSGEGYRYRVRCDCGTERSVRSQDLRNGRSTSCGCLANSSKILGMGLANTTHGKDYGSKLYRAWGNAKNRVFNPKAQKFKTYGLLGIDMDPKWAKSFEAFANDVGEPPGPEFSLDRVDGSKGYWPGNVRWATATEQCRNRSVVLQLTYGGKTRPLIEWCEKYEINPNTARNRYHAGWTVEEILFGKGVNHASNKRSASGGSAGWGHDAGELGTSSGVPSEPVPRGIKSVDGCGDQRGLLRLVQHTDERLVAGVPDYGGVVVGKR